MNKNNNWNISCDHKKILDALIDELKNQKTERIIDLGTGRTSLWYLTHKFKNSHITAMTYPGDLRKINSIKESVENENYTLVEADLGKYKNNTEFDLALAHLLLGESGKFGKNNFDGILSKIFEINSDYLIIIDYKEDTVIDFDKIRKYAQNYGTIQKEVEIIVENVFNSMDFIGKTLKGYLIKLNK